MGKAHESNKEARKQPAMKPKERRAAKQAKKLVPGSPPFMGHHHQT